VEYLPSYLVLDDSSYQILPIWIRHQLPEEKEMSRGARSRNLSRFVLVGGWAPHIVHFPPYFNQQFESTSLCVHRDKEILAQIVREVEEASPHGTIQVQMKAQEEEEEEALELGITKASLRASSAQRQNRFFLAEEDSGNSGNSSGSEGQESNFDSSDDNDGDHNM
jgi:hypothetical protein